MDCTVIDKHRGGGNLYKRFLKWTLDINPLKVISDENYAIFLAHWLPGYY